MNFYHWAFQGKDQAYAGALMQAGYIPSALAEADLALFDVDWANRRSKIELCHRSKIPVFIYPHAAHPTVAWDGMYPFDRRTRCHFVQAPGHESVLRAFGYDLPIEVTGWTYCAIKPFKPVEEIKNILFGAIHPAANQYMPPVDRDLNRRTLEVLVDYCRQNGAHLTVRYLRDFEGQGLTLHEDVTYTNGRLELALDQIDAADVVVSYGTFAYLAVARGKPTLMMGQDLPPHTTDPTNRLLVARSWEKYRDLLAYPLDILDGEADLQLLRASMGSAAAEVWKRQFLGQAFEPETFVQKLERYL